MRKTCRSFHYWAKAGSGQATAYMTPFATWLGTAVTMTVEMPQDTFMTGDWNELPTVQTKWHREKENKPMPDIVAVLFIDQVAHRWFKIRNSENLPNPFRVFASVPKIMEMKQDSYILRAALTCHLFLILGGLGMTFSSLSYSISCENQEAESTISVFDTSSKQTNKPHHWIKFIFFLPEEPYGLYLFI